MAASAALPAGLVMPPARGARPLVSLSDPDVRPLAMRALDAARSAGALHAEVRLSHLRRWDIGMSSGGGRVSQARGGNTYGGNTDVLAIGIRTLVGGSWGFASSTILTVDEAARLGQEAVRQARTTSRAGMPPVELVPAPVVKDGRWSMPIGRDPFAVSREEILDTITGTSYQSLRGWDNVYLQVVLSRLETVFASSEGSYLSQIRYGTEARIAAQDVRPEYKGVQFAARRPAGSANVLPLAGRGWEYIGRAPWYEMIERVKEDQERYLALPEKPVDVGRYDVVVDATTAARFLSATLGTATELDRALGYEANAGGTSYLNDPTAMLGKEPIGAPGFGLNVTANRSLLGGMATVKWDDEGVEPEEFALVKDGLLADFQTTRESAAWLKEGYARLGRPLRSHGCAGGATALDATQLQRPNLRLAPGREKAGYAELLGRLANGIAVEEAAMDMDFNALNGMARLDPDFPSTRFFEVKKGKKVARLIPPGTALLFRAPELWKSLLALGGADSVRPIPVKSAKGEPAQETWHTVEAPPMLVRQLAVIDPTR